MTSTERSVSGAEPDKLPDRLDCGRVAEDGRVPESSLGGHRGSTVNPAATTETELPRFWWLGDGWEIAGMVLLMGGIVTLLAWAFVWSVQK